LASPNRVSLDSGDGPHEKCGVVGVYVPLGEEAAPTAFFALHALQHRGQESAGIASGDGRVLRRFLGMGLVTQVFRQEDLDHLRGHVAIGHNRYSTTGSSSLVNAQPFQVKSGDTELALAHNGNIVNALELRNRLIEWGVDFTSGSDSEVVAHLLASAPGETWAERISYLTRSLKGAYSLTIATKDTLIGVRDPMGIRPLCIGRYGGGWIIASESCALDQVGAQFLREIQPGETVVINQDGLKSFASPVQAKNSAHCIFEHIYFARPDSILDGHLAYLSRIEMGARLAREHPAEADVVIAVPDTANAAAIGFARELNLPYSEGLIRNRYVGRTFIQPNQRFREFGVRTKFNPMPEVLAGKRVVVVDDSIVRGTTTPHIVSLVRKAGALEVHMRVCAPPIKHPCYFGVDMPHKSELLANGRSLEQIRKFIEADSLGYLSIDSVKNVVTRETNTGRGFCDACFTGVYPMPVQLEMDKLALEHTASNLNEPLALAD
jgi:amidophosphoribosyltransferase